MSLSSQKTRQPAYTQKGPNFDSGIITEPLLAFGGRHEHVDPKIGLGLYGPYSLTGQTRPTLTNMIVGLVGPSSMLADAQQWLQACTGALTNEGDQPFLYPHFPGLNNSHPFQCELMYGDTWRESISTRNLSEALALPNYYERVKSVVNLYVRAIEVLAQREPQPNVIICCIPQEVVDLCTVRKTNAGETKRIKKSKAEKKAELIARTGQLFLFPDMDPAMGIEGEEAGHQNLRRGIKAEAMQFGIPTQLAWPRTLQLTNSVVVSGTQRQQDIATRAWNFTTALYYKAGGSPWRLAQVDPGICFIGISFYKELFDVNPRMRTSMAQAFTSAGDGYVLRGNSFEWEETEKGKSPHLDEKSSAALIHDCLDLYRRQNRGSLPRKLVVHKTSRYWEEELEGFKAASKAVPVVDLVSLGWRGIQFYRMGDYPAIRGTYVKFNYDDLLLYTVGYVPFLRTYPGARVPQPLEVLEHHGDSPWNVILEEIMGLTKMNWNTADFACSLPVTIAFSRKVGQILAELPANLPLRPEYRFYM